MSNRMCNKVMMIAFVIKKINMSFLFSVRRNQGKNHGLKTSLSRILLFVILLTQINEKSYSQVSDVTRIVTDFGRYWSSTNSSNTIFPDTSHNVLGFTYNGTLYSTGVNDPALIANRQTYTAGNWWAFPTILKGTVPNPSVLRISIASRIDGTTLEAIGSHNNVKNLTPENMQSDGIHGLDIGTGYANLPSTAISVYPVQAILSSKISDTEPDILVTQTAVVSTSGDVFKFLDAAGNIVGNQVSVMFNTQASLGRFKGDHHYVNIGDEISSATPTGAIYDGIVNFNFDIRLIAFKLSEFGITSSNYSQVKSFTIVPSGETDISFIAYNASSFNVPPSIEHNTDYTNSVICNSGTSSAFLSVRSYAASGGSLSYEWQESTNSGSTWNTISNVGIYSGARSTKLSISAATSGYKYRAIVTESGTGYSSTSDEFTISSVAGSALGGTLNSPNISTCSDVYSNNSTAPARFFLSVSPTGGTGSYSYQWSVSATSTGTYTEIDGAINNTYKPDLSVAGTKYYKVQIKSGCYSNLSTATTATVSGGSIISTTNGGKCAAAGTVQISATASSGTISWFTASTGGTAVATGNSYSPSPTVTTTYYAAVKSSSPACESARWPVIASVYTSALALTTTATNTCVGSGSTITIFNSSVTNGDYTINYTFSSPNSSSNGTATVSFINGTGSLITNTLNTSGTTTVTISGVVMSSGCTISSFTGNTASVTINSSGPAVSNFSVSATSSCTNINSVVTVSSSTLASGTYTVEYNISGTNTLASSNVQMVFTAGTPGTGRFNLPLLPNTGTNNILNVSIISLLTTPNCTIPLTSSYTFTNNSNPILDAGVSFSSCATSGTSIFISGSSSASDYSALAWSTSNGTGTFTNNTTASALTNSYYIPTAADISAGSVYLSLTATANSGCSNIIKTITLSLPPNAVGGTVSSSQSITNNTPPATLTLTGYTGTITNWQKSTDPGFASPTTLAYTTTSLTGANIGNLTSTTYFRAKITRGSCVAYSSYVTISISGSPTISSFTPTTAAAGTTIAITGTNFTGTTAVMFGGTAASSFSVVSSTSITAVVGSGTSGSIAVTNANGTGSLPGFVFCTTVTPSISIVSDASSICSGSTVRFTASVTNGGSSPTYQWKKNGVNVGISSSLYTDAALANGDIITCELTSNAECVTSSTASSNSVSIAVFSASVASSSSGCLNTALNITHTTAVATGIGTSTGLPAGVSAAWSSNTITISGTPTVAGTYSYSIPLTGGCGSVNATGTITVNALPTPTFSAQPGATALVSTDVTYTTEASQSSYIWTLPGTVNIDYTITSGGVGTASNTVTLKWLTMGSKTVTINYTNSNGCSATTATSSTATTVSASTSGFTWTGGGANNLWDDPLNWSTNTLPLATTDIIISSGTPRLNIDYAVGGTLTISGTGALIINPGKTLSISTGGVVDFAGKSVTIKSTAAGTGQLGRIQGSLIGATNVTVERYIPATGRRYRMLTPSVNTTTSIKANWMEGNMNTSGSNVNSVAGYGTQITGPGGNANGFDVTGTNAASLYLTTNGITPGYTSVPNTTSTLSALTGYFLFLRGDRSTNMNLFNTNVAPNPIPLPTSVTTLRVTGTIVQGPVNSFTNALSSAAGGFSLITNPYPAAIDWASVYAASSYLENYYTYWDPNLGFRGGFTTVTTAGISAPSSSATNIIQSGQAFFVTTTADGIAPTISLQESHKVGNSANNVHGIFKANMTVDGIVSTKVKGISPVWENYQPNLQPTFTSIPEFRISLYYTEGDGNKRLTDGAVALFDNQFTSALDGNDAVDAPNWDENIAISRNGQKLAIESRAELNENDTLEISMSTMKVMNYELQFQASNFGSTLLQPLLIDNYLKTLTTLSLTLPTTVPFTVTSDTATSSKNRFKVVFKTSVLLPFTVTKITATKKNESVQVDWEVKTDEELKCFDVERSSDGRSYVKLATVASLGKGIALANYRWVDNNPLMGASYYRIKVIPLSGKEKVSPVANITMDKNKPSMDVYPNPTEGNDFSIKLSHLTKGSYQVIVTTATGQQVLVKTIEHPGGTKIARMVFANDISKGVYRVQVKGEGLSLLSNIIKN